MDVRAIAVSMAGGIMLLSVTVPAAADTTVQAELVPQNKSGVRGSVTMTATDSGDLVVRIEATGLMPGPHAQHIHGAAGAGHFQCASLRDDTDRDGWLTNEEASGEYGDVYLALTTEGDVSAQSGLDLDRMPVADDQGRLRYQRTIPASQVPDKLLAGLTNVHVVQHGIDVNENDKYDLRSLGESSFAAGLGMDGVPEEATDPASCGVVVGAGMSHHPRGGVETGGGPGEVGDGVDGDLVAALGGIAGLLLLSGLLMEARRRSRLTGR